MATLTELLVGADTEGYEPFCDDLYNNLKNHWRRAAVRTTLTEAQAGMIGVDSANDTMWHCIAPGAPPTWRQIVQTTVPVLDNLNIFFGTDSDGSWKYDEATNDAIIVGVPVIPKRGIIYCRSADIAQNFTSLITASAQVRKYIIDADLDSVFAYGFYDDDIGLLTVPANPLRENMLTNSGFGVWSNSDANKGLGVMNYDGGSGTPPVVGETMTAASGAVGKVIYYTITSGSFAGNDAAGVMYLGACDGRFNDNEAVTGGTGGGHVHVNHPDTGVGVDLLRNGEFEAGVGGWTPEDCTLASIAGGQVGNCLELTRTGAAVQRIYQSKVTTVGKIYKASAYFKSGTSGNEQARFVISDIGGEFMAETFDTTGAWVRHLLTFEARQTTTHISLYKNTATPGTMLFDEVSLYEITPCCTAADMLGFDGYDKEPNLDLYREHWGANSKEGSFYSLKIVGEVASQAFYFPRVYSDEDYKKSWYKIFGGRTVSVGLWVKTLTANHFRLGLHDGVGSTYSSWHTGSGAYEWLEVTRTLEINTTRFYVSFNIAIAPNVNGSTIVYVSQPILIFGSSIGAGNYRPRQQEIIYLENPVPISTYHNKIGLSDVAVADLNLESETEGKLPKGAKTVLIQGDVNDSGSAGTDCYLQFRASATEGYGLVISPAGLANDMRARGGNWQKCDSNGDVDINLEATGVGTFDITTLKIHAIQVN